MVYRTNFSNGYVVEFSEPCFDSWLLLPGENLWNKGVRGFLYILALVYLFLGIAIVSDIFMSTIEVITSKKRKVAKYDPEKQESVEIEVFVWNETVANLTLMALGSSAPEILLAVVETVQTLGHETSQQDKDGLGSFTIIGSASFNLLLITGICVVSVPKNTVKSIREFGVFLLTALWSMFAYVWLLIVLKWSSPDIVELWEAFVTLAFFPLLVITAWCQENGWWCKRGRTINVEPPQVKIIHLFYCHLLVIRLWDCLLSLFPAISTKPLNAISRLGLLMCQAEMSSYFSWILYSVLAFQMRRRQQTDNRHCQ